MKRCSKCKASKSTSEFNKNRRREDGLDLWCRNCVKQNHSSYYARNRLKVIESTKAKRDPRRHKDLHLQRSYDMTIDQYEALVEQQNGRCAICKKRVTKDSRGRTFAVDHCHQCFRLRGLLCTKCNLAIGLLEDDPTIMQAAIRHVRCCPKEVLDTIGIA